MKAPGERWRPNILKTKHQGFIWAGSSRQDCNTYTAQQENLKACPKNYSEPLTESKVLTFFQALFYLLSNIHHIAFMLMYDGFEDKIIKLTFLSVFSLVIVGSFWCRRIEALLFKPKNILLHVSTCAAHRALLFRSSHLVLMRLFVAIRRGVKMAFCWALCQIN